jgi:hypothetical protein
VITTEQIAGLVGMVWPQAITPVNIMSGFKKCGIYPLNPGEVTDRQIAPSTLYSRPVMEPEVKPKVKLSSEREMLYRKRYEEGYDLPDEDYLQWIRDNHLKLPTTDSSESCTMCTSGSIVSAETASVCSTHCSGSTQSSLSEVLALPVKLSARGVGWCLEALTTPRSGCSVTNVKHGGT